MAAKRYTIVYRHLGKPGRREHNTYSKELHEIELACLRRNRFVEVIEVRADKKKANHK